VAVNLLSLKGHTVLLRFRLGTDNSGSSLGWWLDDFVVGGPTAVTLESFTVSRRSSRALLHWRMASESQLAGFNLYRGAVKPNRALITAGARAYTWVDRTGRVATYRLQAVDRAGILSWLGTAR
jgi:hypothetical protein